MTKQTRQDEFRAWGFKLDFVGHGRTKAEAWADVLGMAAKFMDGLDPAELEAEDLGPGMPGGELMGE